MPNRTDTNRYTMKFLFTRMEEPQGASWNNAETEWGPSDDGQRLMWKHFWAWHLGTGNGTYVSDNGSIPELIDALRSESESVCLNAAYALGAVGTSAVPALIEAANDPNEGMRMIAVDAL